MTDSERERLYKLKKIVDDFRMTLSGTDQISGGFPTIPEYHSDEQLLNHLEMVHEKFSISGGPDVKVEGSLKTGVSVNMTCPEAAPEVGGAILPTPPPPTPTGACCVGTDCTIETESDCTGMGGTYQGDDTVCDPNPCGECAGITHFSANFTFDADDGTYYFSGSGTVEGDLNESCEASNTELFDVTVHKHGGDDCTSVEGTTHVSCAVILLYLGGSSWTLDTQALMLDHSAICDGSGWPPNSISATSSDTIGFTFSMDLTPGTAVIMNAHVDIVLT